MTIDIGKIRKQLGGVELKEPKFFLPSGNVALDRIMGGGYPFGKIIEIYGDNSTGKSLLATHALVEAQRMNSLICFYDSEQALSKSFAKKIGLDIDNSLYFNKVVLEDCIEGILNICEIAQKNQDQKIVIVWDSVASAITKAMNDKTSADDLSKPDMGKKAQILSNTMGKVNDAVSKADVCLIIINQTREKVGILFGDKKTTTSGKAIGFYASLRLALSKGKVMKEGSKKVGIGCRAIVSKNKIAAPFKSAEIYMTFEEGIDRFSGLMGVLADEGVVDNSSKKGWYLYDGKSYRKTEGEKFVKENRKLFR